MNSLIRSTLELIKINQERSEWSSWLDDESTYNYVREISKNNKFSSIFDEELIAGFIPRIFYKLNFETKEDFNNKDCEKFINLLYDNVKINVKDFFIILPLNKASISENIFINPNTFIIEGDRNYKISYIANIVGVEFDEMDDRLSHTEKTRSPNFFDNPILIHKITHQYNIVNRFSTHYSFYSTLLINLIYFSKIYPSNQNNILDQSYNSRHFENNSHVVVQCKNQNWVHNPLRFDYKCDFNLDWIKDQENKNLFNKLIKLLSPDPIQVNLNKRFLRALRFFNKGINVNKLGNTIECESDAIFYFNISIECMLLKANERYKSRKIKTRVPKLLDDIDFESSYINEVLNSVITARGDYVHQGKHYVNPCYSTLVFDIENTVSDEFADFRKIVASLLSKSYNFLEICNYEVSDDNQDLEEIWFSYLRELD
ncbi:MAG: hypothetical protein ISS28_06740 [Candidatus Cloacimonetes bacterium]|nr:hypothetical protein [Candidatus Cloacimonadota bacterium]